MQKRILNEIPTVPLRGRILSSTRSPRFLYEEGYFPLRGNTPSSTSLFFLFFITYKYQLKKEIYLMFIPLTCFFNVTKYHDYTPAYNQFNP